MMFRLFATTTMGFESVLAHEVKNLGFKNAKTENGGVAFDADWLGICRANLWLRSAGRVYIELTRFYATTFDALFDGVAQLPWSDWIGKDDAFPVAQVTTKNTQLWSKSTCQSICKKAIVRALEKAYHIQHFQEQSGACFSVRLQIERDEVVVRIDSSGSGLHKRGYRVATEQTPLLETLAAGLILLSRWRPHSDVLMDPFCGSGSFLIEAAYIAQNKAPGIDRGFIAESWPCFPQHFWDEAQEEVQDLYQPSASFRIVGSDINKYAVQATLANMKKADVKGIPVQTQSVLDSGSRFERGYLMMNPPYQEHDQEQNDIKTLYTAMGHHFRARFLGWNYYVLTSHVDFQHHFNQQARKHRKVYNGGLVCYFYQYF